jgi:DNA-binding MarR family transcriptional regulator
VSARSLPPLGEVLEFMRLMWEVDHGLQRISKRMETTLGVTGPQRLVLRIVGKFPGMPAGHLADLLHLHPSTLSGIVQRLHRQRLLHRRPDPRDRRRALLSLTDRGRRLDVQSEGTVEAAIRRVLDRTPESKLRVARELLGEIAAALRGAEG